MIFACWWGGQLKIDKQLDIFEFSPTAGWVNMIPFSRIYALQGFFLIVFVYLKERKHSQKTRIVRSRNVYLTSTVIIFINAFTYGFCDSLALYVIPQVRVIYNVIFMFLGFLMIIVQIPFKFYLTKEFLFLLYDELKNSGISSKIMDLKQFDNNENPHYSTL
jgi:hypothetical protein